MGRSRRARPAGFTAPRVAVAFLVAATALAAFVVVQAHEAHPMVPPHLFRSRTVAVSVAVGFAFIVGYYGLPFVMSLYLQQQRGLSSLSGPPPAENPQPVRLGHAWSR